MIKCLIDKSSKTLLVVLLVLLSGKAFNFALGLMLLDQTKSAMSFGINMIIYPLVSLIFLVPIGNLVDRYRHKKILIYNFIFRLIIFLLFYAFLFFNEFIYYLIPRNPVCHTSLCYS